MLTTIKKPLKTFNYRLFFGLLFLGFIPTVYTTVRVFLIGQLPDEWSFSIAGQLSWVNLFYEILNEAIILPLFFFVAKVKDDKTVYTNRLNTGLLAVALVYIIFSSLVIMFAEPMVSGMATDLNIAQETVQYIRIESIANIFILLTQFTLVALISLNKSKYLYVLTLARLFLCIILDTLLVSVLPFSLNLGVNGIGYSNIIVNSVLFAVSVYLLSKENIYIFRKTNPDFLWMKDFLKVGGISGVESFVRNVAYMLMISRMVNVVGEQGTYWVANNFIWGWLLLPVLQLGEVIKQEVASNKDNIRKKSLGYFTVTGLISGLWFVSIPIWKPFMAKILGFNDVDKLFNLVLLLVGFYVLYAFQSVFDSTFYGLGKTNYMLFESIVTNTIYYGAAFIFYITGLWTPTLTGIALLFGIGNAFDGIVSFLVYRYLLKKEKINIFNQ